MATSEGSTFIRKLDSIIQQPSDRMEAAGDLPPNFDHRSVSIFDMPDKPPNGECIFVALQPPHSQSRYVEKNYFRFSSATAHNVLPKINTVVIVSRPNQILNTAMRLSTASLTGDRVGDFPPDSTRRVCDIDTSVIPQEKVLSEFLHEYVTHSPGKENKTAVYHMRRQTAVILDREIKSNGGALAHISDFVRHMYIAHRLRTWEQVFGQCPGYCEYYDCDKWELNQLIILAGILTAITQRQGFDPNDIARAGKRLDLINTHFYQGREQDNEMLKKLQEKENTLWTDILKETGRAARSVQTAHKDVWLNEMIHFVDNILKKHNDSTLRSLLYGNRFHFPHLQNASENRLSTKTGLITSENSDFIAAYLYNRQNLHTLTTTQ